LTDVSPSWARAWFSILYCLAGNCSQLENQPMDSARESRTERVPKAFPIYPRVFKDIPRFAAITLVAPGERFNALAIFLTPRLSRAIVFNVRMSSFDHARRTTFFFFILVPFVGAGLLSWHI
jgi:hypothetical protein